MSTGRPHVKPKVGLGEGLVQHNVGFLKRVASRFQLPTWNLFLWQKIHDSLAPESLAMTNWIQMVYKSRNCQIDHLIWNFSSAPNKFFQQTKQSLEIHDVRWSEKKTWYFTSLTLKSTAGELAGSNGLAKKVWPMENRFFTVIKRWASVDAVGKFQESYQMWPTTHQRARQQGAQQGWLRWLAWLDPRSAYSNPWKNSEDFVPKKPEVGLEKEVFPHNSCFCSMDPMFTKLQSHIDQSDL